MNKKLTNILIVFTLLMLSIAFVSKQIIQNDTFYLIKLGDYIYHNGIDLMDHFSWITGLAYTYPHWLHSVFLYLTYNNFGFDGLYIYDILTFFFLGLSIYYVNLKINKNKFLALFISLLSFPLLKTFIGPRSLSISSILFLWEIYYIIMLTKTGKKKYILFLAIDSLLIANIHGTIWIMYFVLFLPFIVNQIIYQIIKKKKLKNSFDYKITIEKTNNIKPLLIAFIISFIMGLLTPTRICYTYFLKTIQGPSQSFIVEHLPLTIIQEPFVIISIFLLFFSKEKIKLHELFMIGGLLLMAFMSFRHLIFFYTIGLFYLSIILTHNVEVKGDHTFDILYNKLFSNKLFPLILLLLSVFLGINGYTENSKYDYIPKKRYPIEAVQYIKNNLDYENVKLYNDYNDGSYLLFNDIKVFIDSRCDLYMEEFNKNTTIVKDYLMVDDDFEYERIFNKYNIEYVLLNKEKILYYILKNDSNYKTIYQDDYYILYHKEK